MASGTSSVSHRPMENRFTSKTEPNIVPHDIIRIIQNQSLTQQHKLKLDVAHKLKFWHRELQYGIANLKKNTFPIRMQRMCSILYMASDICVFCNKDQSSEALKYYLPNDTTYRT